MPNVRQAYGQSPFISTEDIEQAGGKVVLEIANAVEEEGTVFGQRDQKESQLILYFKKNGKNKMNIGRTKANVNALCDMFGDNSEGWAGQKVMLYVDDSIGGPTGKGLRFCGPNGENPKMYKANKAAAVSQTQPAQEEPEPVPEPAVPLMDETDDLPF